MQISEHFSSEEFECKCGCGSCNVDSELIAKLEQHTQNKCSCVDRRKQNKRNRHRFLKKNMYKSTLENRVHFCATFLLKILDFL